MIISEFSASALTWAVPGVLGSNPFSLLWHWGGGEAGWGVYSEGVGILVTVGGLTAGVLVEGVPGGCGSVPSNDGKVSMQRGGVGVTTGLVKGLSAFWGVSGFIVVLFVASGAPGDRG